MTTTGLKKKLVTAINREEDKGLLEFFYAVISEHSSNKRISKKQYNKELDETTGAILNGEFSAHEKFVKGARKWHSKK